MFLGHFGSLLIFCFVMESAVLGAKSQNNEDEDYTLLLQANESFTNNEYDKCLELLETLETKGDSNGPILRHNFAVVKFYKSGCTDHVTLLKELNELDVTNNANDTLALPLKHSSNTVARYNKAVVYFHRHMYTTASEILGPLIARLESMEKQIALLVATLHLQLLLSTNEINRADAFLEYLQDKLNFPANTTYSTSPTTTEENIAMRDNHKRMERSKYTLHLLNVLTNVLKRKPIAIPDDGTPEFAALKAHQYYIMKDFQMSAKQLMRINNDSCLNGTKSPELNTCIANNMGVIHLRVRHYAIAAKFFQNAITFDKQIVDSLRNATLQSMSSARSCEILYNLGISMLHLRRPREAFQCFLVPIKFYHSNPRLWFRMSEACIMEHEVKLQLEANSSEVSNGSMRQQSSYSANSSGVPEPTLEFAALCLRNALTLAQYYKSNFHIDNTDESNEEEKPRNWRQVYDNNFCNPSKSITIESLDNMLAAIYAAYSFVSLRLGDHVTALEMAQDLLQTERLSDAHKLLGHMYAGEALMMMHKPVDARIHLDPAFVTSLNAFDFETRDWQVKSLDAAQNIVRYNLAVAMAIQNDYEASRSVLATLTHPIVASKALALKRHVDHKLGYNVPAIT